MTQISEKPHFPEEINLLPVSATRQARCVAFPRGSDYKRRVAGPFTHPIDASTRYCAVYGYPVRHSASPAMQNAALAALGLNWRYLAFEVDPGNLKSAIEGAKVMQFIGVNLTVPHKLMALEMLDAVDEQARVWGAANTVRFEGRESDGEWKPLREFTKTPREIRSHGFNTDADAITRAVREDLGVNLKGAKVLMLGAGGAGRAAALKIASENVQELFLVNRTRSKAEELAQEIRKNHPEVKVAIGYPKGAVDLLLNATSLGLKPEDPLPLHKEKFSLRDALAVYDMIYRPAETTLLRLSKEAGCRNSNGLSMLLYQGAAALEIWTGQTAPLDVMRRALEKNIYAQDDV